MIEDWVEWVLTILLTVAGLVAVARGAVRIATAGRADDSAAFPNETRAEVRTRGVQWLVVGSILLVFGLIMVPALLSPDQLSRM
ncbi:hypothetical protein SAMN05443544_1427 [Agromyces cerinus subsp. cerinus]|uniref:Uncharacterized protein n=1 Tax=Agromyces cerinus subsp. cerinus TaxID=232089 RepID=A0A1N6ESN8_9MICO|nr:hypothetical protein SAMN05443544_1427 [Agromyces cerinus subsp. cerinus]